MQGNGGVAERLGAAVTAWYEREGERRRGPKGTGRTAFFEAMKARGVRGATRATIYSYLEGKTSPTVEFLTHAADVLGVSVGYLAGGEEQSPAPAADEPGGVTLATVFWKSIFPMVEARSLGGFPGWFARIRKGEERRLRHAFETIALASPSVEALRIRYARDERPIPASDAVAALSPVARGLAAQVGALPHLVGGRVRLKESEFDRYVSGLLLALEAVGDSAERIVGDATLADYPVEGWTDDQWLTIAKGGDDAEA